jgi:hypothetical protein
MEDENNMTKLLTVIVFCVLVLGLTFFVVKVNLGPAIVNAGNATSNSINSAFS